MRVTDVFTPTQPARDAVNYVERSSTINDDLVTALNDTGTQVLVYGASKSGKTTLIQVVHQRLFGVEPIVSRCDTRTTFDGLVRSALSQLRVFRTATRESGSASRRQTGFSNALSGFGVDLEFEKQDRSARKQEPVLPPQVTPEALARLMGAESERGRCWLIEDLHVTKPEVRERVADVLKVFCDEAGAQQKAELRVIIAAIARTAEEIVERRADMEGRLAQIHVPPMTPDEIEEIITLGEQALQIRLTGTMKADIANYASRRAHVCHKLCSLLCSGAGVFETQVEVHNLEPADLERAVSSHIRASEATMLSRARSAFNKPPGVRDELAVTALLTVADGPFGGVNFDRVPSRREPATRGRSPRARGGRVATLGQ